MVGIDRLDWVQALTVARDGAVWALTYRGALARIDPRRGTAKVPPATLPGVGQGTIAAGPRGRLWVTAPDTNKLYEVAPGGGLTAHGPGCRARRARPASGWAGWPPARGGRLWATEAGPGRIARVVTRPACAVPRLIGRTVSAAGRLLRRAGCRAVLVRRRTAGGGPVRWSRRVRGSPAPAHPARPRGRARRPPTCAPDQRARRRQPGPAEEGSGGADGPPHRPRDGARRPRDHARDATRACVRGHPQPAPRAP